MRWRRGGQGQPGKAAEEAGEGEASFDPAEGGAETVVRAGAEREVLVVGAGRVEGVRVGEPARVAVGGAGEDEHGPLLLDGHAGYLGVLGGEALREVHRRVVTQDL